MLYLYLSIFGTIFIRFQTWIVNTDSNLGREIHCRCNEKNKYGWEAGETKAGKQVSGNR